MILAYIVPKNVLQNATTWNQGVWLSASVTGHALGGLLIAYFGITGALTAIVMTILLGFIVLTGLKPKPPLNEKGEQRTWESVKEGLQFVYRTKELLGAIFLDLFAVLFGGAVAMVPVYARTILHVGAIGYGWLNAASDIGSICIVVLLTIYPCKKTREEL